MLKRLSLIVFMLSIMFLSACSSNGGQNSEEELALLEAELMFPDEVAINEEILLSVKVTYGSEVVNDADEVIFEIWRSGKKDGSVMIDAFYEEDGVYSAYASFAEDGVYYAQPHVTARGMHTMPVGAIIAGTPSEEELKQLEEEPEFHHEHDEMTDH